MLKMDSLKQKRIKKGYSRKQLSELIGITETNIGLLENGVHIPNKVTRYRIESFFNEHLNWLEVPIKVTPYPFPSKWQKCEKTFRRLLNDVASLPEEFRKPFVSSVIKHLRRLHNRSDSRVV